MSYKGIPVAVWMSNPTAQSTEILDVWTMPLYGNTLASVRVPNAVIPSGDSVQVWVCFHARAQCHAQVADPISPVR